MFRVALLGRWHVHAMKPDERYLREFLQIPDCAVTCVWDKNPEVAEKWGAEHGYPVEYDLETLLSREDVDGVIVTAEPKAHREILVAAANHKKHIFTEKVLALTLEDAYAIKDAVEKNGVKFGISFYRMAEKPMAYAKKLIEDGTIGKPSMFRCMCNVPVGLVPGAVPDYWFEPEICGGGSMLDLGFNSVYIARYILGEAESVVSAFSNSILQGKAEDCGTSVIKFKSGVIGVIDTAYTAAPISTFELTLYGTEGTYNVRFGGNDIIELQHFGGAKEILNAADLPEADVAHVMQAWVDACTKGTSDKDYGIDAAVDMVKIMVAAYESDKDGKRVYI
ncbi:MAG: Gfo/Idh/MocA family oxidoreductase [Clostridiales bacterium]|nr:Gfo/Idh/MocA family oxidoreductase [Clostridiales bacterium]